MRSFMAEKPGDDKEEKERLLREEYERLLRKLEQPPPEKPKLPDQPIERENLGRR